MAVANNGDPPAAMSAYAAQDVAAAMPANGSCEETWSVVLHPLASALTMVVSENGLQ